MIRLHMQFLRVRCLAQGGHRWSERCWPISCARCGRSIRVVG